MTYSVDQVQLRQSSFWTLCLHYDRALGLLSPFLTFVSIYFAQQQTTNVVGMVKTMFHSHICLYMQLPVKNKAFMSCKFVSQINSAVFQGRIWLPWKGNL